MTKVLPVDSNPKIVRLIERGLSTEDVAKELGVTRETLMATINCFEVPNCQKAKKRLAVNDDIAKQEGRVSKRKKARLGPKKAKTLPQPAAAIEPVQDDEEAKLASELAEVSAAHDALLEKRKQFRLDLGVQVEKLEELEKFIEERKSAVLELLGFLDSNKAELSDLSVKRKQLSESLEKIRLSKKITVLVYSDGGIKAYRGEAPIELSLDGWEAKHKEIITDGSGDYEDLTIRQTKIISRLMVIQEQLSGSEVEFVLDNGVQGLEAFLP